MSKKRLRNRIENLFEDLGSEVASVSQRGEAASLEQVPGEATLQGWKWECDRQDRIIGLSPEVEMILGYAPKDVIGRTLTDFALTPESVSLLRTVLQEQIYPSEVDLHYQKQNGDRILVRLHIFSPSFEELGESQEDGLWGYAQVLHPEHKSMLSDRQAFIRDQAHTDIRDLLKRVPGVVLYPEELLDNGGRLSVPIQVQGVKRSLLEIIDDTEERHWSEDERLLVEQVADQLSLALDNARLFQETQAALAETQTLYAITSAAARSLELDQVFLDLLDQILGATGLEAGLISMVDEFSGRLELAVHRNMPEPMVQKFQSKGLAGTLCDVVYQQNAPLSLEDLTKSSPIDVDGIIALGLRSYLGVPIVSRGKVLGTLCVFGYEPIPGDFGGISLMQVAGQQIGIAIENAQLFQQTQARSEELAVLNEMGRSLATLLNIEAITEAIYTYTARLMPVPNFFVALYDVKNQEISFPVVYNEDERIYPAARKLGSGLTDYILRTGESLLLNGDIPAQMEALGIEFVALGDATPALSWMGVPITYGKQVLGVIALQTTDTPNLYSENERNLLTAISSQAANAIQNARLFAETQRRADELAVLNEMGRTLTTRLDIDEVLENVYHYSSRLLEASNFYIALYHPETNEVSFPLSIDEGRRVQWQPRQAGNGLTEYIIRTQEPILIKEGVAEWIKDILGVEMIGREALSWLGVPLSIGAQVFGVIAVQSYSVSGQYDESHRELLTAVASQAAIAIQNARLNKEEQRRLEVTATLLDVTQVAASSLDLTSVLRHISQRTAQVCQANRCTIFMLDEHGEVYQPVMSQFADGHIDMEQWEKFKSTTADQLDKVPLFHEALRERRPMLLEDPTRTDLVPDHWLSPFGIQKLLAVPLVSRDKALGVMSLDHSDPHRAFTTEQIDLAQTIGGQVASTVENARLFQVEQRRRQIADTLSEVARVVGSTLDLGELSERMLDQLSRLVEFDTATIQLIREGKRQLIGFRGIDTVQLAEAPESYVRPNLEDPLVNEVIWKREPIVLQNAPDDPRWEVTPENSHVHSWMAAPLIAGREVVGLITLDSTSPNIYTQEVAELIRAVAAQTAVAIQNANLFQQTQAALGETAGLYQASAELNTARDYNDILDALRKHTIIGQSAHHISLNYFDRPWTEQRTPEWIDVLTRWTQKSAEGYMSRYPLQAYPSIASLLSHEEPLIIQNFADDPRLDVTVRDLFTKRYEAVSGIFVPLVVGGRWVGFINANYPGEIVVPEKEIRRLMALAAQAAVAIQNLLSVALAEQRAQEAQVRSEELALVNRVVSAMVSSPDMVQVLDAVAGELIDAFDLSHAGIALLDDERTQLTLVAEKSSLDDAPVLGLRIPLQGNPAMEQVITNRRPVMIPSAQTSPLLAPIHVLVSERCIQAMAIFPIIAAGEVIGTISLDVIEKGRIFTDEEMSLAETLVGQISTSIQNANLYEQTQQALAETENLYRASAELNAANSYDEILEILRKSTVLGHENTSNVSISLFDRPWVGVENPEWFLPIARWSAVTADTALSSRYPMSAWSGANQLLRRDEPTVIENTQGEARLDETTRSIYVERMGAKSLIFAPLVVGGQWIGHINGVYTKVTRFAGRDLRSLMALAGQAAVAIQNLRLLDETRRRAAQLETAAEIARDTSSTLALDTLLKRSVNLILERYGFYHASIFLLDESRTNAFVRASTGEAGEEMIRREHQLAVGSQSVIGYVTEQGEPLVLNDVRQSPTHRPNPLLPDTQAELGIPMKIGDRIIGALDVQATEVEAFSQDDVSVLQTLADQIAVAVDNARSYELVQQAVDETRRRVQELSVIYDLSQSLASAPLETVEIAQTVARYFVEVMDVPEVSVSLLESGTEELHILVDFERDRDSGELLPSEHTGEAFLLSDFPATDNVMRILQPLIVHASDPSADPAELAYLKQSGSQTLVVLPLAVKGVAFGVIELEVWDEERVFTTDQINLAMTLANSAATALENARLYEEQIETAEQLREVDKLKSQFLANMSHELRTPLNSIIGFSRVILKGIDGPVTDLQKQDLTAINSAGQHLLQLINDVLDISKIEAGKMDLAFDDQVSIGDLVTSAMSTAVGLTKDKSIKLVRDIPDDLPLVRADPTRIRQVLINFLSNAAKFTDEGTITVKAEAQTGPKGNPEIMVKVIDTGPGIAKEDQSKLFQPFSQVDASPTRKVGGSGLGLSISRLLIDLHNGRIGMESEPGKGSTFYFTIPIPIPEPLPDLEEEKRTILAIDDDRQVISLYERYLKEYGYQVIPVTDPSQAVDIARQVTPFAITLDVMMPSLDGWQVLEALKDDPSTRAIPVIICSIVDDRERGFSLGAVGYLTKPILEEELVGALNRLNGDGSIQEVLVVDDDADDLRLVQRILEEHTNYQVRLAHGGPEGLVAIQTQPPHAIVLDLFMPELDGFTLLETVRGDPNLQNIPVIIFTAGDLTETQHQRLEDFAQKMLHKAAFKEEELLNSIESVLKRLGPAMDE